jgi:hypothetical protein
MGETDRPFFPLKNKNKNVQEPMQGDQMSL